MNHVQSLVEVITDSHLRQSAMKKLQLVKLVILGVYQFNFGHIIHLEELILLFRGGLPSYYKEYQPKEEKLTLIIGLIAEQLRSEIYKEESEKLNIDTVIDSVRKLSFTG